MGSARTRDIQNTYSGQCISGGKPCTRSDDHLRSWIKSVDLELLLGGWRESENICSRDADAIHRSTTHHLFIWSTCHVITETRYGLKVTTTSTAPTTLHSSSCSQTCRSGFLLSFTSIRQTLQLWFIDRLSYQPSQRDEMTC